MYPYTKFLRVVVYEKKDYAVNVRFKPDTLRVEAIIDSEGPLYDALNQDEVVAYAEFDMQEMEQTHESDVEEEEDEEEENTIEVIVVIGFQNRLTLGHKGIRMPDDTFASARGLGQDMFCFALEAMKEEYGKELPNFIYVESPASPEYYVSIGFDEDFEEANGTTYQTGHIYNILRACKQKQKKRLKCGFCISPANFYCGLCIKTPFCGYNCAVKSGHKC